MFRPLDGLAFHAHCCLLFRFSERVSVARSARSLRSTYTAAWRDSLAARELKRSADWGRVAAASSCVWRGVPFDTSARASSLPHATVAPSSRASSYPTQEAVAAASENSAPRHCFHRAGAATLPTSDRPDRAPSGCTVTPRMTNRRVTSPHRRGPSISLSLSMNCPTATLSLADGPATPDSLTCERTVDGPGHSHGWSA